MKYAVVIMILWTAFPINQAQSKEEAVLDYNYGVQQAKIESQSVFPRNSNFGLQGKYAESWVEYKKEAMYHRLVNLWTQYIFSILIFAIVMGMVLFGIVMSYKQFKIDFGSATKVTTIKFGRYGVEVSTSVTGIVILFMALAFFYLYVVSVFPITEIGTS